MKDILEKLFNGELLPSETTYDIMKEIGTGNLTNEELASLLTVYRMRPISSGEFAGFREALYDLSKKVNLEFENRIDIVGSGGDGKNSFNISTLSCFVVAGAGYKVSKHGNYAASSISGSSNLLQSLGYVFTDSEDTLNRQLDKANLCFLHAPLFHPAMKFVAPVRKAMKVKTFFNIIGPTVNPSKPQAYLLGAYSEEVADLYSDVMGQAGYDITVVHNIDGYDEISLTDRFIRITNSSKDIFSPEEIGFDLLKQEELYCGDSVDDAKQIFLNVLDRSSTKAQRDVVIVNSAFAIQTLNPEKSLDECRLEAEESIDRGNARSILKNLLNNQ
ncbi:anthranilate phosphoribosyltransferase [Membranihabitans maritimus]|uniref:anthranilate phosphoribosyltransferase n=1 Tax=Membranihabitans maritimus TaxID=2904244 RepID=UPI001F005E72|nr:anthranilate phosphoribosyltransferase [Membranihabitans maritimus]